MALNINNVSHSEDILITAAFACEHIIHAARDVGIVKREVFSSVMFEAGEKVTSITDFDILRKEIDLEHLKISRAWVKQSGISSIQRKKLRKKWSHGLQSIFWFINMGCPYYTFSECCKAIDDALRMVNTEYRATSGMLLDPELLAERILEKPEYMVKLFEQVQSRIRNGSVKSGNDAVIDAWFRTDYTHAIGWDQYKNVVPSGWGDAKPSAPTQKIAS